MGLRSLLDDLHSRRCRVLAFVFHKPRYFFLVAIENHAKGRLAWVFPMVVEVVVSLLDELLDLVVESLEGFFVSDSSVFVFLVFPFGEGDF